MNNIAISFEHVSKMYQLGVVGTGTLSRDIHRWWVRDVLKKGDPYLMIGQTNDRSTKGDSDIVYALRDIDFDVPQGEVVGIIGRNGAGKSTLLKLLSRITAPSTGKIKTRGRIASLLEVGTGFHSELTGRENIYLNGSIMGMTKKEIDRKLDAIVDFAGVERYIDTPVKRYSSGMQVRLGFSVAAFLEPEILVVDEVLAVGDAEFQKKAIGKMKEVSQGGGRTVLFVSHNMASVRNLCNTGIVLKNGMVDFKGNINDAIDHYLATDTVVSTDLIKDGIKMKQSYITVKDIRINGTDKTESDIVNNQEYMEVYVSGHSEMPFKGNLRLRFRNMAGVPMASFSPGHYNGAVRDFPKGDFEISYKIALPKYMAQGDYLIDCILYQPRTQSFFEAPGCMKLHVHGSMDDACIFIETRDEGFAGLEVLQ